MVPDDLSKRMLQKSRSNKTVVLVCLAVIALSASAACTGIYLRGQFRQGFPAEGQGDCQKSLTVEQAVQYGNGLQNGLLLR